MGMSECVQYIRDNFEKKYADNIKNGLYDIRDLKRLRSDSTFASCYVQVPSKLDEAVDLVHISFKFRNDIKVYDLSESSFDKELFELGGVYFHNKDINGHRILWLKVKVHRKDAPAERLAAEKLGLIFAIEKAFNESPLHQIVVLLDMTACGLTNLDLDFVKYIITVFKSYYPTFLAYMLIYDMPWIFNAAWKVIKAWLSPEAVARIKFVTKADIQTYVKPEDLLPHMSGTDTFEYSYRPGSSSEPLYPEDDLNKDKKVHFQEVQEYSTSLSGSESPFSSATDLSKYDINANTSSGSYRHAQSQSPPSKRGNLNNSAMDRKSSVVSGESQSSAPNNTFVGRLLTVSPGDELIFNIRDTGDSFDIINLTNSLPYPVAFKVKTTSPEKFRVRPSSGLIKSDKTEEVYVYLVPDQAGDVSKDKFLILAMGTQGEGVDPNQLFKDAPKDKIMQHKLKCSISTQESSQVKDRAMSTGTKAAIDPLLSKDYSFFTSGDFTEVAPSRSNNHGSGDFDNKQIEQLEKQNQHMQLQLNVLLGMQLLTILVLLLVMVSYSCFGEDLFTHFLALPFDFCHETCARKC